MKRQSTIYGNSIEAVKFCGKNIGYQVETSGRLEPPYEISPISGKIHNYEKCEGCQQRLKSLTENLTDLYIGKKRRKAFPNCCSFHSNLKNLKEFDVSLYNSAPKQTAQKIIFTNQHIINNHEDKNWYKLITDYIEWAIDSFGKMPKGCGLPLFINTYFDLVPKYIKNNNSLSEDKRIKIIDFIESFKIPIEESSHNNNPPSDFNILVRTYEKWFKIFPFELNSYFGELKPYFEKNIPLANGKPERNIYSGILKFKPHTKDSLIDHLVETTKNLVTKVNALNLYEQGLISDAKQIQLELLLENRRLKLNEGYENNSKDEGQRYRKILKEWLKDEKEFMNNLLPLINNIKPRQTKVEKLYESLLEHGFFELQKVKTLRKTDQEELVRKISTTGIPYMVAMFDHLGYFTYLMDNHFDSQRNMIQKISEWINQGKPSRAIKGNINVLNPKSSENRNRYTAHHYIDKVKNDYKNLN
ncbi:hypothetical protein [Membranihabitans maritimus]|uniref:hypothetical protein n=1 Tax=Membranihabitans maritimus TaxID=2904244 RepID=UPI001F2F1F5C|nr:hypothetical protein [Membranihabitans maritimus]